MNLRPKAKRRIVLLMAIALALALACGIMLRLANRRQAVRLEAERVSAMAACAAGNYPEALPHLAHYLEKAKDSDAFESAPYLDALFAYGKSRMNVRLARLDNLIEAKSILLTYLAARPDDLEAQHTLLQIYPRLDYQKEQLSLCDAVLAKHPTDPPALLAKVQALLSQPRPSYPEARKACDLLNASAPQNLQGQLLGMEIRLRMLVPPADLIARADSLRKAHDGDPRFELLLGSTLLGVSHAPIPADGEVSRSAPSTLSSGPATAPVGEPAPSHSAETAERMAWQNQGRRWLQTASERPPVDPDFVRCFVDTADLNNLYPQSLNLLLKDAPALHDARLNLMLIERLWEGGYFQDVLQQTSGLDSSKPVNSSASLAYRASAIFEVQASQEAATTAPETRPASSTRAAEASNILKALAQRKTDPVAQGWLLTLAAHYQPDNILKPGQTGSTARLSVRAYESALAADPDNAAAYLLAGDAYAELGETEPAASMWDQAGWHAPQWATPHARIARLRLSQGRTDEAMSHARAAVVRSPQMREARAVDARAAYALLKDLPRDWGKEGAWTQLLKEVQGIQDQWPAEPETLPLYVTLLAESGRRDEAIAAVDAGLSRHPAQSAETLLALEEVSRAESLGLSSALLERVRATNTSSVTLAMRHAMELLKGGDPSGGLESLKQARTAAHAANDPKWMIAVATYLSAAGDPAAAAAWVELGDAYPGDLSVQSAVLGSSARYADREFWRRSIERLKALTGDEGQLWRLERCRWLLGSNKESPEAVSILTELTRQFPREVEPHRLLGLAYELANKTDRATEELGIAATLRPDQIDSSVDLFRVLLATGKAEDAQAALDRCARSPGLAPESRLRIASCYEQSGNIEKAVELLSPETATQHSDGPTTRISTGDAARDGMLARLLARLGRVDEAASLYVRLLGTSDAPAQDLADGAEFFAARGDSSRSGEFLTRLAGSKLSPGMMQVTLGRFHERYGTQADALRFFTSATVAAPASPLVWRELAGYHLRGGRLTEAADAVSRGTQSLPADSTLASLSADITGLKACKDPDCLRSLAPAFSRNPADPAATEVLHAVLQAQARADDSQQQIAMIKPIAQRYPGSLPAQERLVGLYLAQRQFQNAADVATRLMQASPFDPEPARLAAMVCLDAHKPSQALDAAGIWRERSGGQTLEPDLCAAAALVALDRPAQAVERLAPYLASPTSSAQTRPSQANPGSGKDLILLHGYAQALICSGRAADAAPLLKPMLADDKEVRDLWLLLTADHKSEPAAIQWIEQAAPTVPAGSDDEQLILAGAWRGVGVRFNSVAALQKARDLVAPMTHRPDANVAAWAMSAEIAQDLGDYDTAEVGWRRLLQAATASADASHPASVRPEVRNNLAYVLLVRGDKAKLPEARQLAEQAVAASPDDSNFHDTLARIYSRLNNRELAIKTYRVALGKDAQNVEAMIGLADELSSGGRREDLVASRALLLQINHLLENEPHLTAPLQEQLKTLRARAALDPNQ